MIAKKLKTPAPLFAAAASLLFATASAQTTLVDEDWQTATLLGNNQSLNGMAPNPYPGWTYSDGAVKSWNNRSDYPDDSTVVEAHGENQVVELNGDSSVMEYDLSHNWTASDTYLLKVEIAPSSWGGTNQRYVRPSIRQVNDNVVLWDTAEDSTTAMPTLPIDGNNNYFGTLPDYPSELTFFFEIDASTFSAGAENEPIKLRLDSSGQRSVYINNVSLILGPLAADSTAPNPDPTTWETLPTVQNFTEITMRADSAIDNQYGVEYYFENETTLSNSGWQDSREWTETGLAYNTNYTYRVKARDNAPVPNETGWSTSESAMTLPQDLTPPSPDPLTWDTVPTVADYRSITMSVNAATDTSGVEYKFFNVTNATDSGWQDSRFWTQKELDPDTEYTYEVRARDKSPDQNVSTTPSAQLSATTPAEPAGTLYITRFQDPVISDGTGNPDLGNWVFGGGSADNIRIQKATGDGVRTDTDLSIPGDNRVIQFEWESRWMEYDIDHNWSSTDTFTLTLNASPQSWSGESQRYIRPEIRQQDGTVLWDPGENMSGPEKTALPLYSTLVGSSYQDDANLSFSYTIPASAFSTGTEGQPIRIRIGQSGARGLFVDNVHLSVTTGGGGSPEIAVEEPASTDIVSGVDSRDFGTVTIGSTSDLTFTIRNTGTADLNLTGTPEVDITGANAGDFSVTATPTTPVTSGGGTTTFTVQFSPGDSGARTAQISIANDDSDENPFLIDISGTGQTAYAAWATGSEPFDGDANGDGVQDGIAFLLGAAAPGDDAAGLLPTAIEDGSGNLVLSFNCLPIAARGGAILKVAHSASLSGWTATANEVPDDDEPTADNDVTFVVDPGPVGPPALNSVTATIDAAAAAGGKLFGRLEATE